ncbi:MAG: hypothetical protein WC381_11705 [Kiritimatiellia bacterium]|jgi:hypothetical protein
MAELTRSYDQVSTTLPKSHYRRKLTLLQKCLWDDIITWPTYCGIFSLDEEERAWYHGVPEAEIHDALLKFETDGKIRLDGNYVWNLGFVSHQSFNTNGLKAALKELLALTPRTSLASEHYRNLTGTLPEGSATLPEGNRILDHIRSDQNRSPGSPETPPSGEAPLPADITQRERDILSELKSIQTYPLDYPKDLKFIRTLSVDFPTVDILDTVKVMALWLDRKPREKASRLRLRNFCKTAASRHDTDDTPRYYESLTPEEYERQQGDRP